MEQIRLLLNQPKEFDAHLKGTDPQGKPILQDAGDLMAISKDNATVGGRPAVLLTFTVQLPDGTLARAQTVTTLGNFMTVAAGFRGRYGEPPYGVK